MQLTWPDRLTGLKLKLGRDPTLGEMLAEAIDHTMTPAEIEAQRQSYMRAMAPCEHGVADFEECPQCMPGRTARVAGLKIVEK